METQNAKWRIYNSTTKISFSFSLFFFFIIC